MNLRFVDSDHRYRPGHHRPHHKTLIFFALHLLIGIFFSLPKQKTVIFTCEITWNVKLHLNLIFHNDFFFLSFLVPCSVNRSVQFYLFTLQQFWQRYVSALRFAPRPVCSRSELRCLHMYAKQTIRCFHGARDNPLIFLLRFDIITSPNCEIKSAFNCSIIQPNLVPPLRYYNEIVQSEEDKKKKKIGASSLLFIY